MGILCFSFKQRALDNLHTFVLIFLLSYGSSLCQQQEVCKMRYKGFVGELDGKTVQGNEKIVAFSSEVRVKKPATIIDTHKVPPSIFFIIDNSGSMRENDPTGSRYKVTQDLIDTIKNKFGESAEVGVAVFQRNLYYKPEDDPRFKRCSYQDTGAYIGLLNLSKNLSPDNKTGYEILKKYLDTATYTTGSVTQPKYIGLKYKANPPWIDDVSPVTHINVGFAAAKDAFKESKYPKNRHFIIFLSDGEATYPSAGATKNNYQKGENVPTTFTVFFTRTSQVPPSIQTMTENIRKNGYSDMNDSSRTYAIQTDYPTLMKLLSEKVLSIINKQTTSNPDTLILNGINGVQFDAQKQMFLFNKLFPLTGKNTDFSYRIKFTVEKDTIVNGQTKKIINDSISSGQYTVTITDGISVQDTFEVKSWSRELGIYNDGNKTTKLDETMDKIEVRFSSNPGDANYTYSTVSVEIRTKISGDCEKITLSKQNDFFSSKLDLSMMQKCSQNNGSIETAQKDYLIISFKNQEDPILPLDTLQYTVETIQNSSIVTFVPKATNPSFIGVHMIENKPLDKYNTELIDSLTSENKKQLKEVTRNGKCYGMLIQLCPDSTYIENKSLAFTAHGSLSIFDVLGNPVIKDEKMYFNNKKKTLNYVWNYHSTNGRIVGEGVYFVKFNNTRYFHANHKGIKDNHHTLVIGLKQ